MKQHSLSLIVKILSVARHHPNPIPLLNHSSSHLILSFSFPHLYKILLIPLFLQIFPLLLILLLLYLPFLLIHLYFLIRSLLLLIFLLPIFSPPQLSLHVVDHSSVDNFHPLACRYVPVGSSLVSISIILAQMSNPIVVSPSLSSPPESLPTCRYIPSTCDSALVPLSIVVEPSSVTTLTYAPLTKPAPLNVHPMLTWSKPTQSSLQALAAIVVSLDDMVHREPISIQEALQSPHWTLVVQEEVYVLSVNNTWSIVPLPSGRVSIGCKWLFRIKRNAHGDITRYKARFVAKGFSQKLRFDFQDIFSHVIKSTIVCMILSLALNHKWCLR